MVFPSDRDGKTHIVTYDVLQDSIPAYLNIFRLSDALPLDVITLVDRDSGSTLAVYRSQRELNGSLKWFRAF